MSGYRSWAEVKPRVAERRRELLEALAVATPEVVLALQIEVRLLATLTDWFEKPDLNTARIGPADGANPY